MVKQKVHSPPRWPRHSKNRPIRQFKMQRGLQKVVDLVRKTITLHLHHTFWYSSLPFFFLGRQPREIS